MPETNDDDAKEASGIEGRFSAVQSSVHSDAQPELTHLKLKDACCSLTSNLQDATDYDANLEKELEWGTGALDKPKTQRERCIAFVRWYKYRKIARQESEAVQELYRYHKTQP